MSSSGLSESPAGSFVDDVKDFFALVAQHRVANAAANGVTDPVGTLESHFLLRLPPETQIPIAVESKQDGHAPDHKGLAGGRKGDASDADVAVARRQEQYDLGGLDWTAVDAAGSPDETLRRAKEALGIA